MFEYYGQRPPAHLQGIQIGGICPHCGRVSQYRLYTTISEQHRIYAPKSFVASYACSACSMPIPILWDLMNWDVVGPIVTNPRLSIPAKVPFELSHVPDSVAIDIREALDCYSVRAFNAFASMCRRTVQAICRERGEDGTNKVQDQIRRMAEALELDDELREILFQIMLNGHDGAHPHLPSVDAHRAELLLALLGDLTYELYTRPGRVKAVAEMRKKAILNRSGA